jgi:hypothetical protein
MAELGPLFPGGATGGAKTLLLRTSFLVFQEDCVPVDEHRSPWPCSNFMAQVACLWRSYFETSALASFTQTRQGLEKKMTSGEYDNLFLWRL